MAEGIGDRVLLFREYLGDYEQIIEEEDFPLVEADPLLLCGVRHLVEAAVADEAPVGQRQVGPLLHHRLLDLSARMEKLVGHSYSFAIQSINSSSMFYMR